MSEMSDGRSASDVIPKVYLAMACIGLLLIIATYVLFDGRPLTLFGGMLLLILGGIGGLLRGLGRRT
jgi:hypothetical protein